MGRKYPPAPQPRPWTEAAFFFSIAPMQTLADLNALPPLPPSAPLADKLARARAVLAAALDALPPAAIAAAYTGGKDSGVVLALWRGLLLERGLGPLRALSVDTGLKFPQVTAFRDRLCADWGVELALARPEVEISAYPVAADKVACCHERKILPLCRALRATGTRALLSGIRRDEHPARAGRPYAELRPATEDCPEHWQLNPILDWTELDVWAFLTGEGLPFCELYLEGYRSLGCMPCTRPAGAGGDERAGRDPDKERQMEVLKGLGYF
jgi:phosphoadenosine phosphosulfate reductase